MTEAEIYCVSLQLRIPDLDLTMTKGDVAHIPLSQAQASVDLQRLRKGGGVKVRFVERFRERRAKADLLPIGPAPTRKFVQPIRPPVVPAQVIREVQVAPPVDEDRIISQVTKQMEGRFDALQGNLTQAVQEALAGVVLRSNAQSEATAAVARAEDDVPTFIPEKIGGAEPKTAAISVESATGGDGVEDAAAALKALKTEKAPAKKAPAKKAPAKKRPTRKTTAKKES